MKKYEPVAATEVEAKSLFPKARFAFFGHTLEYQEFATRHPDDLDAREADRREHFQEAFREVCRLAHTCIIDGEFDSSTHDWILHEEEEDRVVPTKFTAVANQVERPLPALNDKKSKVFPGAFAAICTVLRDILSKELDVTSPGAVEIRRLCGLGETEAISIEQANVLKIISEKLMEISSQANPNWPITYDGKRPSIKVDVGNYFVSGEERSQYATLIEGKYFVFRRALLPNPGGKEFIREQLTIYSNANGTLFRWTTKVGPDEVSGTFRGVLTFPRKSLWFVGYDEKPLQRMWVASFNFRELIDYRRSGAPAGEYVSGLLLSNTPNEANPEPACRRFVARSIYKGEPFEPDFGNGARFLTRSAMEKVMSQDMLETL